MKTIVYLIRHGDVENPEGLTYGRERDVHLSKIGIRQIESLVTRMKHTDRSIDFLYSSPLTRTVQTAEIIAQAYGGTHIMKTDDLLETESANFAGRPLAWMEKIGDIYAAQGQDYTIESPEAMARRITEAVTRSRLMHPGKTMVFVGHGHPLAFGVQKLLHPAAQLPSILLLHSSTYLHKGQAWRLEINADGTVTERKKFTDTGVDRIVD